MIQMFHVKHRKVDKMTTQYAVGTIINHEMFIRVKKKNGTFDWTNKIVEKDLYKDEWSICHSDYQTALKFVTRMSGVRTKFLVPYDILMERGIEK